MGIMDSFDTADRLGGILLTPTEAEREELKRCLRDYEQCEADNGAGAQALRDTLIMQLLIRIRRMADSGDAAAQSEAHYDPKIAQVMSYINENLCGELSVDAGRARFSEQVSLYAAFKAQTGVTVHTYVRQKRLVNAARLIREGTPAKRRQPTADSRTSAFHRAFARASHERKAEKIVCSFSLGVKNDRRDPPTVIFIYFERAQAAAGELRHAGKQERRGLLAVDALFMALGERLVDGLVDDGLVHGVLLRDRVRDEHAGLEAQIALRLENSGQILRRVDARVNAEAALTGVERGQFVRAVAEHGHALRLQILQRQAEVEDGLCARAHDHDRRLRQLLKVGRDVHGRLGAAVHAADAAGSKDLNACHVGDHHRRGDGGGAVRAARADDRQVAAVILCTSIFYPSLVGMTNLCGIMFRLFCKFLIFV